MAFHFMLKTPCHAFAGIPLAVLTVLSLQPALVRAQDGPGSGDGVQRSGASKLERVEINSRPQSDTDLRRRAPVAKQIYGREELEKYGDTSIADVLKRLPGITAGEGGLRLRGLGAGYTQVLVNGESVPPGFQLDQVNPHLVERVEISKAGTAELGGQGVAGTINIVLKNAPRVSQRDLQLRGGYNAERPTGGVNFTWSEKETGGLAVVLPVSVFEWLAHNEAQALSLMAGADGAPALGERSSLSRNWGHGFSGSPRVNVRLGDEETLSLQLFLQGNRWNFANEGRQERVLMGVPSFSDDVSATGTSRMARLGATYVRRIDEASRIELKGSVQARSSTFDSRTRRAGLERRVNVGETDDRSVSQGGKYSWLAGDQHTVTVGWQFDERRRDETRTSTEGGAPVLPGIEGQGFSAAVRQQALYLQDEWDIDPQWSAYLGVRGEQILTRSVGEGGQQRNHSRVLTPTWHVNYKLDPKGGDIVRASLTRSYKAPSLDALLGRAWISSLYPDLSRPNEALSPDRVGNPALRPELATGLDLAFERYAQAGGMVSVGVFYRRVKDLIRDRTVLRTVDWAPVQRWVAAPENLSKASTAGLEFELKGRGHDLLPFVVPAETPLNVNLSLSLYRSRVDGLAGPDNRLDGQQPWSATIGADYRLSGLTTKPIVLGGTLAFTPRYSQQQTLDQNLELGRYRSLDLYASVPLTPTVSVRLIAQNLQSAPADSWLRRSDGTYNYNRGTFHPWYGVVVNLKL